MSDTTEYFENPDGSIVKKITTEIVDPDLQLEISVFNISGELDDVNATASTSGEFDTFETARATAISDEIAATAAADATAVAARAALLASAKTKLLAGDPLTEAEADLLLGLS